MGVVNAAIWFGAAIFFTAVIGPAVFSQETHKLFGETAFPYYAGGIAMIMIRRYFLLQIICAAVALLHFLLEKISFQRKLTRFTLILLLSLFGLGLIGRFGFYPKMEALRQTMYFGQTAEQKEKARSTFGAWHGFSQVVNLVMIGGLFIYLIQLNKPVESVRYGGVTKFRG
ncbi:hypothetical protein Cflav_PD2862 [Pedosphaera parvula Ellin514]|uniref:TMEM205-like domain-containing protein n=2 Tax=Pedosphaera TaxID=1032526 RepID=B9XK32_PEDPL|nr:hypothetical protein Cflav_PD2862 [Pedosphaera parvula Ellin514]